MLRGVSRGAGLSSSQTGGSQRSKTAALTEGVAARMAHSIVASNVQTGISRPLQPQRQAFWVRSLTGLAEARQAAVSRQTLELYSARLSSLPDEDVRTVLQEIADADRKEGETAFPVLGKIVERVLMIGYTRKQEQRTAADRSKQEEWFWRWVNEQIEDTGKMEQEVLDGVRIPGFTGRTARNGL